LPGDHVDETFLNLWGYARVFTVVVISFRLFCGFFDFRDSVGALTTLR
jgi:hypothetical protein